MQALPQALAPLARYRQFILYKEVPRNDGTGKVDKLPVHPTTGHVTDAHDPSIWVDAQSAMTAAHSHALGLGFVFTEHDPFFFVDIDSCLVDNNGQPDWSPTAHDLLSRFAGAAVEVSHSMTGLHVIGSQTLGAAPAHGCKNAQHGLELYTSGRFVALTGTNALGDASTVCDGALLSAIADYFPPDPHADDDDMWTRGPCEGYAGPADDAELIEKACASTSAEQVFGSRASFAALYRGDVDALSRAYPDAYGNRAYDESSADAALAAHLAFWTGCDCDRMLRLMQQSGLARPKWEQHRTYLTRTIRKAASRCTDVYRGGTVPTMASADQGVGAELRLTDTIPDVQVADTYQYMSAHQQVEYFRGCVYVQDMHRVWTPRGSLLRPEQFRATYGGYIFALDAANDKTTKNAWEAFVESQAVRYPIAEGITFRPERPTGELVEEESTIFLNTYAPAGVQTAEGDVSKFTEHLAKLLPDDRDRAIMTAYMAACVQRQGHKFQWAPLLQGVEGNGKTMLSYCTAHACGYKYSHFPKASEVGSKHNSWLMRRVFIGIEDVYYPEHRREIIEDLKPLITNQVLPIEPKQVDQFSTRVCANFILNSNHRDALRKTRNDRRIAPFYTAQQEKADLDRDGMGGEYFPDLYDWLRGSGKYEGQAPGYAKVAHFLSTYEIPAELDPSRGMHRAPITSTTEQAMQESKGQVEQEIEEAIGEGRVGFAGGWVSSIALGRLLDVLRKSQAIPPRRRREILNEMGYDWHPALPDGRTSNTVSVDNGKPRLFIKHDHPDRNIQSPSEAIEAYVKAQSPQSSAAEQAFGQSC